MAPLTGIAFSINWLKIKPSQKASFVKTTKTTKTTSNLVHVESLIS